MPNHYSIPCILLLASCILHPAFGAEPSMVGWGDLVVEVEFEDPFEALTGDQLMHLSIYARVKGMQERTPETVSEGMAREADEAEAHLREEGVDIEGLLAKREEIKQLRMKRASATNPDLDGATIRIPGYALPLEYDGKQVTEFLLVPWVGACIHTPPPPPNQIVYVALEKGFEVRSRFEPVWVTGRMTAGATSKSLFLVDGRSNIDIGYSMTAAVAERYQSGPKARVRPGRH